MDDEPDKPIVQEQTDHNEILLEETDDKNDNDKPLNAEFIEKYFAESEQRANLEEFVDDDDDRDEEQAEEDSDDEDMADPMPHSFKDGELVHAAAEIEAEDPYSNLD